MWPLEVARLTALPSCPGSGAQLSFSPSGTSLPRSPCPRTLCSPGPGSGVWFLVPHHHVLPLPFHFFSKTLNIICCGSLLKSGFSLTQSPPEIVLQPPP